MQEKVSVFLCGILRHHALEYGLPIDLNGGWMDVPVLLRYVNGHSKFKLDKEGLEEIVRNDGKGRYCFNNTHTKIRCCQGHSIEGLRPLLTEQQPPRFLYHGTTTEALAKIEHSGALEKMERHAVHLFAEEEKAWIAAERRRNCRPVVIRIDAEKMAADGFRFFISDNEVWLTDRVPAAYFTDRLFAKMPLCDDL